MALPPGFLTLFNVMFFSPTSRLRPLPGQLTCNGSGNEMTPKLWVALEGGRVVVFDASSWSMLQDCIQVGESQLVREQRCS